MNTQKAGINSLTCTIQYSTLCDVSRTLAEMDATSKKLIEKLRDLQMTIAAYERQANAIREALESIGMKVEDTGEFDPPHDVFYAKHPPFRHTSLVTACKRILNDFRGQYLSKSQVEYLAAMGAYSFSTEDTTNSVDVTLRRLAEKGYCEVQRSRGPTGNKYRWLKDVDEDRERSRDAAATNDKRK